MSLIRCPSCSYAIPLSAFAAAGLAPCPMCGRETLALLLPALVRNDHVVKPPLLPETPPAEGESACFYNPNRRATKSCDHCGVFISDAWAAQWGAQMVCLKCLDLLRTKNKDQRFEPMRTLWDNVALGTIAAPLIIALILASTVVGVGFAAMVLALTIITAPISIFLALRFWNAPRSLVPRGRLRLASALFLSVLVLGVWVTGLAFVIAKGINS